MSSPLRTAALGSLQDDLQQRGFAALLVVAGSSRDPHVAPFVGSSRLGACFVLVPATGSGTTDGSAQLGFWSPMERDEAASTGLTLLDPATLDVPRLAKAAVPPGEQWAEILARALALAGLEPARVALCGSLSASHAYSACRRLETSGWSFAPGEEVVERWSRVKTPAQLEDVSRAADATCSAFRAVAARLASAWDGSSDLPRVGELRRLIGVELARCGLDQPAGNIVAPGEEGAVPHSIGRDERTLRRGETLIVDVFPRSHLFADCTRTFVVGPPSDVVSRAHADVLSALERAESLAKPGVTGWSLQEAACEDLSAAGWPTPITDPGTLRGYVHGLGHGVGWAVHEAPRFAESAGENGRLLRGDVITLEPGLYEPAGPSDASGWAVRIEDTYRVEADGVEALTRLSRSLDPRDYLR